MKVHRITKPAFFIALIVGTILSSCYYDNEQELYPAVQVCDTASLTYDSVISDIINGKCALPACHGGSQNPNLSNFAGVSANIDRVKARAVDLKTMPPASATQLTDCEITKLQFWINNGAPQN